MLSALKETLGFWTNHSRQSVEAPLFSGSAYFSNRVPKVFSEKWLAHGGEISSGATWDVRARYFFAIDPSEPWVTKLFSKSVTVFHAGWIAHCVDEAFQVPIAEYILDDRFVTEPPFKLTGNFALPIFVPLSEPGGPLYAWFGETRPTPVQTSDTPSTPTSMPRKRKREQAYFDSPSGSLVFSGFDKDGMPRRPKKQRKLRFDPSFSPDGGRSGKEAMLEPGLGFFQDHHGHSSDDDKFSKAHGQGGGAGAPHGHMTTVRSPNTPEKPLSNEGSSATHQRLSLDEHLSKSTQVSSPAVPIDKKEKMPVVRTIDFTNLPPRTRRCRFPKADRGKSGDAGMTKPTEHKVKTPKKISFANHARVCVYTISPRRQDSKDDAGVGPSRHSLSEGFEDGSTTNDMAWMASNELNRFNDSTAKVMAQLAVRTGSPKIGDDIARPPDDEDQSENDTLTLTMEEVGGMRRRLLESAEKKNGVDIGQLATLFELGKTYQGMAFHHVW